MTRILIPAALLTALTAAAASAGNFPADRGFDDVKSYSSAAASNDLVTQNTVSFDANKKRNATQTMDPAKKFGSPHPNFESGRR